MKSKIEDSTVEIKSCVDIVISEEDEVEDKEAKGTNAADENSPTVPPSPLLSRKTISPRGSMTFYTLGKTYMWMSRAKVTAWYKQAFQIPCDDGEEGQCEEDEDGIMENRRKEKSLGKAMSSGCLGVGRAASPRRLYVVKSDEGSRERGLTLDPDYHRGRRSNLGWNDGKKEDEKNFSNESVSDMMLIASGGGETGREDTTFYRSKSSQDFSTRH